MKTDNRPLRNQAAAYCPTCKGHTEQTRGPKRGERHCWSCGETFTLTQSRAALESSANSEPDEPRAHILKELG